MNRRSFLSGLGALVAAAGAGVSAVAAKVYRHPGMKNLGSFHWIATYEIRTDEMWATASRLPIEVLLRLDQRHALKIIPHQSDLATHLSSVHLKEVAEWMMSDYPSAAPSFKIDQIDYDAEGNLLFGYDRISMRKIGSYDMRSDQGIMRSDIVGLRA